MDYEKKYKDALERLRAFHRDYDNISNLVDVKRELESIFPELRESEDERVRKSIVATIEQCPDDFLNPKNRDRMLDWLEKQKEQECPGETNDDALQTQLQIWFEKGKCSGRDEVVRTLEKYGLQKPMEWSEEDEKKVSSLLAMLTTMRQLNSNGSLVGIYSKRDREKKFDEIENWLKSLRPRPSWKPSGEQIQALQYAVSSIPPNYLKEQDYTMKLIGDVIQHLKKL